jgi:uncharacterized protein (DUF433 family)
MDARLQQRIEIDPAVMTGKPVIRGSRVPVELVIRLLGQGVSEEDILREHPRLQSEDIRAALTYAAEVLSHEELLPLKTG